MSAGQKPYTSRDKWIVSIMSGLLFLLLASPILFNLTNSVMELIGMTISVDGCPNPAGLILHALLFTMIARAMMR